jgi:signal transduction histidine kinase
MPPEALAAALLATAAAAAGRWRRARRRVAVNRALHEIRRPLQALALLAGGPVAAGHGGTGLRGPLADPVSDPVRQAISAVSELEREINGGPRVVAPRSEVIACRLMADACVRRWQSRARLSRASITLEWSGPDALVRGDGAALSAALENLIVNAIEHGGPTVIVAGRSIGRRVRLEVRDDGCGARAEAHRDSPAEILARLRGRGVHGHGLPVASRTIAEHGGTLDADFGGDGRGSIVTVVLPVAPPGAARPTGSSPVRVNW